MNIQPYAGFWKRAFAFMIDALVLLIPNFVIQFLITKFAFHNLETTADPIQQMTAVFGGFFLTGVAVTILQWIYCAWLESSKYQATLGKMALGIKVVNEKGERISFGRATGRFFAKIISYFTFYFGCFMAGFTTYRQALHDIIASTFVVSKESQPGETFPQYPFNTLFCVLSAFTSLLILIVPIFGILVATILPVLLSTPTAQ